MSGKNEALFSVRVPAMGWQTEENEEIFLGKKKNQFEAHERKKRTHHTQHSKWSENEFD